MEWNGIHPTTYPPAHHSNSQAKDPKTTHAQGIRKERKTQTVSAHLPIITGMNKLKSN